MFESVRKWLVNILIRPDDVNEYILKESDLDKPNLKIPLAELKKTDAAKKVLLLKGIAFMESSLKELQERQANGRDVKSRINHNQRQLRIYHEQLELIDYRVRKEELPEAQLPVAQATEVKRWREQILFGDIDSFFDEALENSRGNSKLENGLYNRAAQFYNLLEQKNLNLITTESFEVGKIELQLSFLALVDRIQAGRID